MRVMGNLKREGKRIRESEVKFKKARKGKVRK